MSDKGNWLDDPEWEQLRRKQGQPGYKLSRAEQKQLRQAREAELKAREEQARAQQEASDRAAGKLPEEPKKVNVSVNVTLPRVNVGKYRQAISKRLAGSARLIPGPIKSRLKNTTHKQRLMIGTAGLVVLVIAVLGVMNFGTKEAGKQAGGPNVLAEQTVKIDFKPLLPNGNADETTAYKTATDGQNRPIYTFTDQIGSVGVTVTEQPLPEKLKGNTDSELEKMAKDLYLTEVINQSNPRAYLGTSVKGPQTVIFVKNDLMVFIQSQSKIEKDQWSDYVTRLVE